MTSNITHSFFWLFLFLAFRTNGQQIVIKTEGTASSIRGLSVVNDRVIWASGSNGKVVRSTDGGETWEWMTVPGYEKIDFRDIEAFDERTAVIMGIAEPGYILRTTNGGKSWKAIHKDTSRGVFMDAMAFKGRYGVVAGDPLPGSGYAYLLYTKNRGRKWHNVSKEHAGVLRLTDGEAMFASSGTNIVLSHDLRPNKKVYALHLATGGRTASFISAAKGSRTTLPLLQGKESTGANSVAAWDSEHWAVVGGDFLNDKDTSGNCALSTDGGAHWFKPIVPPSGYRSCVAFLEEKYLLTCGTSGVDLSQDGGIHWTPVSDDSFHVCQKAKKGRAVFLAGTKGRIARFIY